MDIRFAGWRCRNIAVAATVVLLASCGGGGVGGGDVLDGKQATYTIGGTVAGLTIVAGQNAPVVLLVNTSTKVSAITSLTVSGNRAFTFPGVPAGTEYSLAITSPPGYACTFDNANGNGVVGTANTSDINITCSANSYSIGGTVTGLGAANPGLQLANGAATLAIAGDGPFTFVQPVPNGTAYDVRISIPPSVYQCSLRDASGATVASVSGSINGANVTTINVVCAAPVRVTVTGLAAGTSIQLSNAYTLPGAAAAITETLTVTGAQSSTFATALPAGSSYAVTVSTPHPNFNCTVGSGAGTVAIASVNIAIGCVERTFTIGGTSTGVSGNNVGLTLSNSYTTDASNTTRASEPLPVSSDGVFTFVTRLPTGRQYAVSAAVTNPNFDCTVVNGTGTVGTSNVTAIAVNCAAIPTMSVTSVVPANGTTGVSRMVNPTINFSTTLNTATVSTSTVSLVSAVGSQSIVPTAAGNQITVVPSAGKLLPITPYTLGVSTQVRGANGDRLSAPLTSTFTTRDGSWQSRALIEGDDAGPALFPQVAFDRSGNALAVWSQTEGGGHSLIYSSRYTASTNTWTTFTTATIVSSPTANNAKEPQLAIDAAGNAMAVWFQSDGARLSIYANRYSAASGTWGTPVPIESDNSGDARSPQVAFASNGDAVAMWHQSDGTRFNIYSNRYSAATAAWGTPQLAETDNAGSAFSVQFTIDSADNIVAVWAQGDGTRDNIAANRYRASTGSWGTATLIETDNASSAAVPQVVCDASGNALVVWYQFAGNAPSNIWANRYDSATDAWGTAVLIESDNTSFADYPQIAIDPNGNALAVWEQSDGFRKNIWANRYTAASRSWGLAQQIETDNAGTAMQVQIATDAAGNALATWAQYDGTRFNVTANRYTAISGSWGTPVLLESDNSGGAAQVAVAVDAAGNGAAVWVQDNPTVWSVFANRFE